MLQYYILVSLVNTETLPNMDALPKGQFLCKVDKDACSMRVFPSQDALNFNEIAGFVQGLTGFLKAIQSHISPPLTVMAMSTIEEDKTTTIINLSGSDLKQLALLEVDLEIMVLG